MLSHYIVSGYIHIKLSVPPRRILHKKILRIHGLKLANILVSAAEDLILVCIVKEWSCCEQSEIHSAIQGRQHHRDRSHIARFDHHNPVLFNGSEHIRKNLFQFRVFIKCFEYFFSAERKISIIRNMAFFKRPIKRNTDIIIHVIYFCNFPQKFAADQPRIEIIPILTAEVYIREQCIPHQKYICCIFIISDPFTVLVYFFKERIVGNATYLACF